MRITKSSLKISCLALLVTIVVSAGLYLRKPESEAVPEAQGSLTKEKLANILSGFVPYRQFPTELEVDSGTGPVKAVIEYALDPQLQEQMEGLFRSYKPDYGAFVAVDPATGRILALVSFSTRDPERGNLALKAGFPAASVFKIVSAAAAIGERQYTADTLIPFNGAKHTLYRGNVLKDRVNRWTRYVTLKSAFAQSINSVFGKIGAFTVEPAQLRDYADRFGFNKPIQGDLPVEPGRAPIPDDPWGRAEAASGYTRQNTMSPLQGALIAAAIANEGVMMEPFIVSSLYSDEGSKLYAVEPRVMGNTVDPKIAAEVRALMRETVVHGTSRKSFRGFFKKEYSHLQVGGKTGSLTGEDPPGKHDWFVGYATDGNRKIALAALTVHDRLWRVKSSYLARKAIETFFRFSYKSS